MARVFRVTIVQHWLHECWVDAEGKLCDEGAPGARFVRKRKVPSGTPGAKKVKKKSRKWYGRPPGSPRPVPLSTNQTAAEQMLAALVKKAELARGGIFDPFEAHRDRPLSEHLEDYRRALEAKDNAPRHVQIVLSRLTDLVSGCNFRVMSDLSASSV